MHPNPGILALRVGKLGHTVSRPLSSRYASKAFSTSSRRQGLISFASDFILSHPINQSYVSTIMLSGVATCILRIQLTSPGMALFLARIMDRLQRSPSKTESFEKDVIHFPSFLLGIMVNRFNRAWPFATGLLAVNDAAKKSVAATPSGPDVTIAPRPPSSSSSSSSTISSTEDFMPELMSSSVENISSQEHVASMVHESFLWVPSLAEADPMFGLPVVIWLLSYSNTLFNPLLQLGFVSDKVVLMQRVQSILPCFVAFGFSATFPAAVGLYWASYSATKLLYRYREMKSFAYFR